jgi:predicted NUDIX family NTP pyrophosphohydrolase
MNKPEFFITPGYGEYMLNNLHYSQDETTLLAAMREASAEAGIIISHRAWQDLDANSCCFIPASTSP